MKLRHFVGSRYAPPPPFFHLPSTSSQQIRWPLRAPHFFRHLSSQFRSIFKLLHARPPAHTRTSYFSFEFSPNLLLGGDPLAAICRLIWFFSHNRRPIYFHCSFSRRYWPATRTLVSVPQCIYFKSIFHFWFVYYGIILITHVWNKISSNLYIAT